MPTTLRGDARERLLPILADLCDATREAVQLSVRCGTVARGAERVHGRELVDVQR
ncbi:hypothetical protein [Lentzea xinjiangensis]|uniref:hypothetical protein n=1 Tax=Lentzea xinjiangensis TaxID=402600 RepID=UPI0015A54773|nr:hypothetical protein [Lentzea xinjiangensis]